MTPAQHFTNAGAAAAFAVRAHDGQVRTGTQFPYVMTIWKRPVTCTTLWRIPT
jgi:hypothetical protein